jgi:glutamine phosphoribosylpyrophosphate amidotransferase
VLINPYLSAQPVIREAFRKALAGERPFSHQTIQDHSSWTNAGVTSGFYRAEHFFLFHKGHLEDTDEHCPRNSSGTDAGCIARLLQEAEEDDCIDALASVCKKLRGSYSILLFFENHFMAAQDPDDTQAFAIGIDEKASWSPQTSTVSKPSTKNRFRRQALQCCDMAVISPVPSRSPLDCGTKKNSQNWPTPNLATKQRALT